MYSSIPKFDPDYIPMHNAYFRSAMMHVSGVFPAHLYMYFGLLGGSGIVKHFIAYCPMACHSFSNDLYYYFYYPPWLYM